MKYKFFHKKVKKTQRKCTFWKDLLKVKFVQKYRRLLWWVDYKSKVRQNHFFFKTNCLRSGDVINRILFYRESLMSIFCENENHLKRWICRRKRWFGETFDELMKRRRWFENHLIWRQLLSKKSRIPIWKYPTLFYKWYVPKRRTIIFQIYVYMIKIEGNWH